ncbi:MAG: neutral zinc metallopeptidase [Chitinophagales bacterium]|nr:neutral zinc metallopeptidase [Chitinophagales bacterium]
MLWKGLRTSSNVEDRRGGGGPLAVGGGLVGVVVLVLNFLLGGDPSQLNDVLSGSGNAPLSAEQQAEQDTLARFVSAVLGQTEDVWHSLLSKEGIQYTDPKLDLFNGVIQSGCGNASASSGPFYCPPDHKVYIDLSFCQELEDRFHAPGDFAVAYVVAHEVGHHVQSLLGTSENMERWRQTLSDKEYNKKSVMLELQADFFAGVWAHYVNEGNILEQGDVDEALNAASAVGDDRLQKQSRGYIVPDAFTHGTSAQRAYWFKKGYETGDIRQGNTFDSPDLQ